MPTKNSCAEVDDRVGEAVDQPRDRELAAQEADRHREERAGRPAFGRRHHAGIKPADHAHDQHDDRPDFAERRPALAPQRRAVGKLDRRGERRIEPAADHDHDHVGGGGEQPGNDAGNQQLGDRDLGEHAVEHEQDARRDQRIERAAACDRAAGEALVVAVLEHLRHRELRHRGGGGDAGTGRRTEARAGPVGRDREPAGQSAEPGVGRAVKPRADARVACDRAHQQEHRDRGQLPVGGEHERRVGE